jgi:hypothetical protein
MRSAFKYLAYLVPVLVLVQAAMIAWAVFGLGNWIDGGGTLNKSAMDSNTFHFAEERGFMIHGINGQMVIPLVTLIVFVLSFFAKVPGGTKFAAILLVDVIVQVFLGMAAHGAPILGMLHGINAFVVAGLGAYLGHLATAPRLAETPAAMV